MINKKYVVWHLKCDETGARGDDSARTEKASLAGLDEFFPKKFDGLLFPNPFEPYRRQLAAYAEKYEGIVRHEQGGTKECLFISL